MNAEEPCFEAFRVLTVSLSVTAVTYDDGHEHHHNVEEQVVERAKREALNSIRMVPATKESIQALKELNDNEISLDTTIEQCSICLEKLSFEEKMKVVETPCSHVYHKECIVRWLENCHMCPLCRYRMPTA